MLPVQFANASDTQLITACLARDEEAWAVLIGRYSPVIYTIPLRLGFPQQVADEIFQEVTIILLEKLSTIYEPERLRSWLVTTTRRACIRWLRLQQQERASTSLDSQEVEAIPLNPEALTFEERHALYEVWAGLDERCKCLLYALFLEQPQRSYEAIARALAVNAGSIGPLRARCLERMRQALQQSEQMEGKRVHG
jgi:RNA polymerase sigma factor (sigma-70 family)